MPSMTRRDILQARFAVTRRILQETPTGLTFSNPFFRNWLLHVRYGRRPPDYST